MAAELVGIEVLDVGAVEADDAGMRLDGADDQPGERRLAGAARADHGDRLAGLDRGS